ncbi:ASST-domain-containing protein [Penicillium cinerascens]|uniref:ASST-domain-containing protein n=1 Tax=Penicillium cinerascens TaxID=70096 RepID=A0A9W9MDJ4_9EURO|nr:ASST-domain-containing protein [Penicillium cinerascens]KAJ5197844.1 ASST-domain-containing protein [Penicillium cinerascens]
MSAKNASNSANDANFDRTFHRFVTRPDIDAPVWTIRHYQDKSVLAPGYWFVAFYNGLNQASPGPAWIGPHIYDTNGELIWGGGSAFNHWNIFDFGVQDEGMERKLTLLSEHEDTAFILDKHYQVQKRVPLVTKGEKKPNIHSFQVSNDGKRALILNKPPLEIIQKVSEQIGLDIPCLVEYEGFRELDLETSDSRIIFEWNGRDWISLNESTYKSYDGKIESMCARGWDILHLNSIAKFPDGDYLLSARHTDALYKISHKDGHIVWRLGGVRSDFQMLGNFQSLPNGNKFICWAYSSRISEHTPDGQIAMQAVLSVDADSYRGFKYPWIGLPSRPPDLHTAAVRDKGNTLTIIHVSWNGASEVYEWHFKMLEDQGGVPIGIARRKSFETSFIHRDYAACVFAEAYNEEGHLLGQSEVFFTAPPTAAGQDLAEAEIIDQSDGRAKQIKCFAKSPERVVSEESSNSFPSSSTGILLANEAQLKNLVVNASIGTEIYSMDNVRATTLASSPSSTTKSFIAILLLASIAATVKLCLTLFRRRRSRPLRAIPASQRKDPEDGRLLKEQGLEPKKE